MKPCDRCGKVLRPHEQFGFPKTLCWKCYCFNEDLKAALEKAKKEKNSGDIRSSVDNIIESLKR